MVINSSALNTHTHFCTLLSFPPSVLSSRAHGKTFFPADNHTITIIFIRFAIPTVVWQNLFLFPIQTRTRNILTTYIYRGLPRSLRCCFVFPFVTNNHSFSLSILLIIALSLYVLASLEYSLFLSYSSLDFVLFFSSCACSLFCLSVLLARPPVTSSCCSLFSHVCLLLCASFFQ